MPNVPTREVSNSTRDAPNACATSDAITTAKMKLGDAIKAIWQNVQGVELQFTRDKTPIDAAKFDSL